jgi:hypothetical protein
MPRGVTLATLRSMLKAEIGDFSGDNSVRDAELNVLLSNKQKFLATSYDWPFLIHRWDFLCTSGTRFYSFPTTTSSNAEPSALTAGINFERPVRSYVKQSGFWWPVDYQQGEEDFNFYDPEMGEKAERITKWRIATNTSEASNADMIEVWPTPDTAQTLRIIGQRNVLDLSSDDHKADLDDMLLVLLVAGEKLVRLGQADAELKLSQGMDRFRTIRAMYPKKSARYVLGHADVPEEDQRKFVAIGGVGSSTTTNTTIYNGRTVIQDPVTGLWYYLVIDSTGGDPLLSVETPGFAI